VLLAVPPAHRLTRRDHVTLAELAGEPFVTTRPGYWQRALADELFARSGVSPAIACEGDEPYTIRGLVSAGVGVGLLPAMARSVPDPPVGWVRLDDPRCRRTLRIAWREDAYLPAAARSFRDFAITAFRERPPSD
jgi:DNA-binding transcriptional LysR family regulator